MRVPAADRGLRTKLRSFTRRFVRRHFRRLSPDSDCSVEAWLDKTGYSGERKAELLRLSKEVSDLRHQRKYWRCKSFMKDEHYQEYKHARLINSRDDGFKTVFGPFVKLIEEEVYKYPAFVKHIPVADYPTYIGGMLQRDGAVYASTDFTAMECHFTKEMMEAMEFELYEYITEALPGLRTFLLCLAIISGINVCEFKHFIVWVLARRMSGEMNTSLGNGFANLMVIKFTWWELYTIDVDCVVEGDDGLITTSLSRIPTEEWFRRLGFTIKIETNTEFNKASFCGLVFDLSENINIACPQKAILNFAWLPAQYCQARTSKKWQLLKAKALSMAHQYPGCPMLDSLAHACIRSLSGITISRKLVLNGDSYHRARMVSALDSQFKIRRRECGPATRLLMEQKFGIPADVQRRFERLCDSVDAVCDLNVMTMLEPFIHKDAIHYWNTYVRSEREALACHFGERYRGFHVGGLGRNAKASRSLINEGALACRNEVENLQRSRAR